MAKKSKKKVDVNLDLNNDGVFDEKDKKIAGRVLATKVGAELVKKESKVEGQEARVDITRKYRRGDLVPEEQIAKWKSMGIVIDQWF